MNEGSREGTLGAYLHEQLKSDITRWVYQPGERLKEKEIAERFGVSRTPIREALRRLENDKLVVYSPQFGYSTRTINLKEFNELYQVRLELEQLSAALAARTRLEGEAERVFEELRELWGSGEPGIMGEGDSDMVHRDESFHEGLAQIGGNGYLYDSLRAINGRIRIIRITDFISPERIEATFRQHAGILEAVQDGREEEARERMRTHVLESQEHVANSALRALARLHQIDVDSLG
ncbi:GntR family transcriptional regulator [Rubrobacter aplysinae]|uniref:GntR family transcriptional regulator n=1 Tax=Rubrobacter aplysinae TaxID=909625 RepID=UPI00069CFA83|nr:GntR family transcriptional regulator [Rubrobacter aplysinae]